MKFFRILFVGSSIACLIFYSFEFSFSKTIPKKRHISSLSTKKGSSPKKSCLSKTKVHVPLIESNLAGIYLFDPLSKVVDLYGSPEQIESAQPDQELPGTEATAPKEAEVQGARPKEEEVYYTRWIYKRNASQYSFILDKQGRVMQIEVLGLSDPHVRTRKGVQIGDWFSEVIQKYNAPEGYKLVENYVLAQYYQSYQLAFRLAKLEAGQPYKVIGIVISAGKI